MMVILLINADELFLCSSVAPAVTTGSASGDAERNRALINEVIAGLKFPSEGEKSAGKGYRDLYCVKITIRHEY